MTPGDDEQADQHPAAVVGPLGDFVGKDFGAWNGLADPTPLDVAVEFLGADPERFGQWFLGAAPDQAFYIQVEIEGYPVPVRIWHRDGSVLKLSADRPDVDATLLETLGEPARRLDYHRDVTVIEGGEWLYPERGIAVRTNSAGNAIAALSVFPPTTADGYVENLMADDVLIEHPAPDSSPRLDELEP